MLNNALPIVFVPGHMCDERLFKPQIDHFSPSHEICVGKLTQSNSIENMAEIILRDAPKRFALVGLSMGGIVAMEIFRVAADRVAGIALMNTNYRAEKKDTKLYRDRLIEKVKLGGLTKVMIKDLKPQYIDEGTDKKPILDLCLAMALKLGEKIFIQQSRALQTRIDYSEVIKTINIPALVLCGEKDKLCPVRQHQLMASMIDGSVLSILEGVGHLSTLEGANKTCHELARWLKTI